MSKFRISVVAGVAAVYPYGTSSDVTQVLREGDAGIECEVPVGPHPEPRMAEETPLKNQAKEDTLVPAAGVATDEPFGKRDGILEVEVLEGTVKVRTYANTDFTEQVLKVGGSMDVDVTETNHISLAVYDATPVATPRAA